MHCKHSRTIVRAFAVTTLALSVQAAFAATSTAMAAADSSQLDPVVVSGQREGTATYEAPTQGSLDAGEPQSVISQHFIENNTTPGANYTDIINIAPSVADTTPNGKGNAESLNLSIRGFQDGQFNVTFDGIPFNDSNDFTHHTTSYFTANTVGKILVDRGPGTAAQVGNATFGGTVGLQSRDPSGAANASMGLTLGSWRTNDYNAEIDTGELTPGGGRALVALTAINSDGAMSNNGLERKNAFIKYVLPVDADTSLTAVAMYNNVHQYVSQFGTTTGQLAQFGAHYSLGTTPSSDSYYGFNFDEIHTDFEYLQLRTKLAGMRVDNKVYTYAYYHKINETNDPSLTDPTQSMGSKGAYDGLQCDPTQGAVDPTCNNVSGQKGFNNYRSVGDMFRAEADIGPGILRGGFWVDYQWNDRALWDVDWTQGGVLDTAGDYNGFQRRLHDDLTSIDPFVEYEFHPADSVTLTPGVRYSSFARKIDADVNPQNGQKTSSSHTWTGVQPSLYALWHPTAESSVYGQFARGFLAPKDKLAYQPNQTAANGIDPQRTTNLQAGGTWKNNGLTLSADVYHIKFDNFFTYAASGAVVKTVGGGSAIFKGVELEGTLAVGAGVNLYANYTHNTQTYADGSKVQYAPDGTYAAGLIFDNGRSYGSLITKHIGTTVQGGNNGPDGGNYDVAGFTTTDLAMGYTFKKPTSGLKDVKVRLVVSNLANNEAVYYVYGASLSGTDMFMTLPGRSYMLGLSADF
jgi:iron complex outermembrane receptor protein